MSKDGGPAFPVQARDQSGMPMEEQAYGMSLRDYFAAEAMNAELASSSFGEAAEHLAEAAESYGRTIEAQIAFNAYTLADAMLAERNK